MAGWPLVPLRKVGCTFLGHVSRAVQGQHADPSRRFWRNAGLESIGAVRGTGVRGSGDSIDYSISADSQLPGALRPTKRRPWPPSVITMTNVKLVPVSRVIVTLPVPSGLLEIGSRQGPGIGVIRLCVGFGTIGPRHIPRPVKVRHAQKRRSAGLGRIVLGRMNQEAEGVARGVL
jgi:hypothetical protein